MRDGLQRIIEKEGKWIYIYQGIEVAADPFEIGRASCRERV